MALTITHPFVSLIADAGDTTLVQPSDWNDTHSYSITVDLSPDTSGGATLGTSLLPWGASFFSGVMTITNATASVSTGTGALVVAGGVGVAGTLYAGDTISVVKSDTATFEATTGTITGRFQVNTGANAVVAGATSAHTFDLYSNGLLGLRVYTTGSVGIMQTTASTSTNTGALVVAGGVGVAGSLYVGSLIQGAIGFFSNSGASATSVSMDATAGQQALVRFLDGGSLKWLFAKGSSNDFFIYDQANTITALTVTPGATTVGKLTVGYTTASTSTTTGALVVAGGVGVAGTINAGSFFTAGNCAANVHVLTDGVTAPGTSLGFAQIYVDTADGDLKVKFGDGTVKTLATDT
jgi:hypothetical protein